MPISVFDCHTVICQIHSGIDACDPWTDTSVIVQGATGPEDAATTACFFLTKEVAARARATAVIEGATKITSIQGIEFDSMDGECEAMHVGKVVSHSELD